MTECIHGLEEELCDVCSRGAQGGTSSDGSWSGQSFALVFIPSLRADTYFHLNRQGDHWKLRLYTSPNLPPVVFAQSGKATTKVHINLDDHDIVHEIAYPYSNTAGGVTVENSRHWHGEIEKANAARGLS